jgi:hypothetical protein
MLTSEVSPTGYYWAVFHKLLENAVRESLCLSLASGFKENRCLEGWFVCFIACR